MDSTLQMIGTTVVGAIMSALILLYTKGYWKELMLKWNALTTDHFNTLDFDPLLASGKPKNGKVFTYKSVNMSHEYVSFVSWFYTNHSTKQYLFPETQLNSMILPERTALKDKKDFEALAKRGGKMVLEHTTYLPIWREPDGHFVYMNTNGERADDDLYFYSDSAHAIQNCSKHIQEYKTTSGYYTSEESNKQQSIYEFRQSGDGDGYHCIGQLSTAKTFDSLFFTMKPTILPLLQKFKDGTLVPKHIPIDPKLGILLYGPPGTGKTGFIAALSNFLGRPVAMLDMKKVKTQSQFHEAYQWSDDRILVLEEIDCMEGIVTRKQVKPQKAEEPIPTEQNSAMMMMMMASNKEMAKEFKRDQMKKSDVLDLGYLLRKLDGLESSAGRVIIATTNHPERIDPALLRPGRLGIQLKLGNATHQMIRDIVGMVYQQTISQEDVEEIVEERWSPAEILKRGLEYPDPKSLLESLKTELIEFSSETASVSSVGSS